MEMIKGNISKRIILSGLFLMLAFSPVLSARASVIDTEESVEDASTEVVQQFAEPENVGDPVRNKPQLPNAAFTTDVFYTQTTLQGIFASRELFFYVPAYWDTKYVYVELQYDASELIRDVDSSMTFSVNGTPVCSYRISYEDGNSQTCFLNIPMEHVNEGYNSLNISAQIVPN